ncbi:hypothetical protein ABZ897_38580 [Nonomuraea sp. NPDC046802]|uniref:hypothetical protein n=1 Tax=Nonomuraea sp. NPDC046802 TaxID=3154919 RepID=UPI0033F10798
MHGKPKVGVVAAGVVALGLLGSGNAVAASARGTEDIIPTVAAADIRTESAVSSFRSTAAKPAKCVPRFCVAKKKRYVGLKCRITRNMVIDSIQGRGPGTLVLTIAEEVAATYKSNLEIAASVVTAGVGFDVTKSYKVERQTRFSVPKGRFGRVEAYPCYKVYTFEAWSKAGFGAPARFLGPGMAMKPAGVHFKQWTRKA